MEYPECPMCGSETGRHCADTESCKDWGCYACGTWGNKKYFFCREAMIHGNMPVSDGS